MQMIETIQNYMEQNRMIQRGDTIVLGISGGADSVCLFFILERLQKKLDFSLKLIHVNHGLRGEAAREDEAFVQRLAKEHQVPLKTFYYPVGELAKKSGRSTEEMGRIVRRWAFEEETSKSMQSKIALAHHKNDQAETILLHLARGTKMAGMAGMAPVSGKYIRPLLCVTRNEIETWLQEEGIKWQEDATNKELCYQRNKIRHKVIPYLEQEINQEVVEHLSATAEYFYQAKEAMEAEVAKKMDEMGCTCVDGKVYLSKAKWESELPFFRREILFCLLKQVSEKQKDIESVHVDQVESLFAKEVGRWVNLPYEMVAERSYEGVWLKKRESDKIAEIEPVKIVPPCQIRLSTGEEVVARVFSSKEYPRGKVPDTMYTKWFDYDIIKDTVVVRSRRKGDYICIDEQGHQKKLNRFFIDEKIPRQCRESIPLLAKGQQILWVIGYRRGFGAFITEKTKRILEIKIVGGKRNGRDS